MLVLFNNLSNVVVIIVIVYKYKNFDGD